MPRNLVIVDDDPSVRASLQHLLAALPDTLIHSFACGDEFLEARASLLPACLILDLNMPGTSGLGVLEALRADGEPFAVVVLTGAGDVLAAVQAMKLGAVDFLEKPCNPIHLLNVVEQAFAKQADTLGHEQKRLSALAKIATLSAREHDVLLGLVRGQPNKIIAHDLGISHRTVEIYRAKLMEKLEVKSFAEAFRIAFTAGLIPEE